MGKQQLVLQPFLQLKSLWEAACRGRYVSMVSWATGHPPPSVHSSLWLGTWPRGPASTPARHGRQQDNDGGRGEGGAVQAGTPQSAQLHSPHNKKHGLARVHNDRCGGRHVTGTVWPSCPIRGVEDGGRPSTKSIRSDVNTQRGRFGQDRTRRRGTRRRLVKGSATGPPGGEVRWGRGTGAGCGVQPPR